jgi:hypothetical protein
MSRSSLISWQTQSYASSCRQRKAWSRFQSQPDLAVGCARWGSWPYRLGRPPAPRPPPGTTADRLFLSPVSLGLLVQVIVIAVEDHLARESAGKLGRTPFLHDGNVPLADLPAVTEPGLRPRSRTFPLMGASIPTGGLTIGFPHQGSLGRSAMGWCGQIVLRKQVSRSVDNPDSPIVAGRANSKIDLLTGRIRVLCPSRQCVPVSSNSRLGFVQSARRTRPWG